MTEVRLLGPVRVVADGSERPAGGAKQSAVLAVLALRSPRLASTDQLIDAVWGNEPPESARNAVQVYVSGLRKVLGSDGVLVEREGDAYRLAGPGLRVDATEFERGVSEGRSALRAGDPARAASLLEDALALWTGTPLSGLEALPFHAESSRALDDTRVLALVDRADGLLRCGALDAAIRVAQQVTLERPFEERAWCLLAAARYHAGRQAEALETCSEVRRRLDEELGIDPSPELAALELAILRQQLEPPRTQPAPVAAPGPAGTVLPALPEPFVGREALVADVIDRLGTSRLVTLVGLGGIGKTSVAGAVAHRAVEAGRPAAFCELETETEPTGALERVCRQLGVDPGGDLVGSLAAVPVGTVVVLDNLEQVEGLAPVVADLLARTRLTVLATSRRALHLADEAVVPVPPLALEAADGGPSPAARLFLERVARVRPSLDRAAVSAAGERVCVALDGIPLAIGLAAARARVLTVEQIARRLEEGTDSALDRTRLGDVPARQASLAAIVASSIDALDANARDLLPWLAELEGWTSLELVEAVVGRQVGGAFVEAVEDLVDAGLADHDDEGRVRLRRPIREYVQRSADGGRPAVVAAVVGRVRAWVEEHTPALLERHDAAVLDRMARDEDPLAGVLARARDLDSGAELAALVMALHRYWLLSGRLVEGRRWIEAACHGTEVAVGSAVRLEILRGTFAAYTGDRASEELLRAALGRAAEEGLAADRVVVNGWCTLAARCAQRDAGREAARAAATAMDLASASGEVVLVSLANDVVGYVASYAGDYEAALAAHLTGLTEVRRSGHEYDAIELLVAIVDDLVGLGRFEEALAAADEAFERVVRHESLALRAQVLTMRGLSLVSLMRVGESRGCLTESLRMGRDHLPDPFQQGIRLALLAVCAAAERDDAFAARLWGAAEATLAETDSSLVRLLRPELVAEVDAARQRLGATFDLRARIGGAVPGATVDAVLER